MLNISSGWVYKSNRGVLDLGSAVSSVLDDCAVVI
jgi:hypothetical protein